MRVVLLWIDVYPGKTAGKLSRQIQATLLPIGLMTRFFKTQQSLHLLDSNPEQTSASSGKPCQHTL